MTISKMKEENRRLKARLLMYEKRHPGQACPYVHQLAECKRRLALKEKPK